MASRIHLVQRSDTAAVGAKDGSWRENASAEDLILEAWSQGFVSILAICRQSRCRSLAPRLDACPFGQYHGWRCCELGNNDPKTLSSLCFRAALASESPH